MSRYERAYGTDWDTLDDQEAMERAYALGVAASLGEYLPEELEAIRQEVGTAYERSVIDLAFDEGKNEARETEPPAEADNAAAGVWSALIDGETATVDSDDVPTGGRDGIPKAIDRMDVLDPPDLDSTEPVDLPEFLKRD